MKKYLELVKDLFCVGRYKSENTGDVFFGYFRIQYQVRVRTCGLVLDGHTSGRCITRLSKMSIDPKFIENHNWQLTYFENFN